MNKVFLVLSLMTINSAFAEKWNRYNDPKIFRPILPQKKVEMSLTNLPLSAALKDDRLGWSDSYWPSNLGGIAYRWNHPNPEPFKYRLHTKEEVASMSKQEISQLSPAELYDISQGDYNYTLTKKVLERYNPLDLWWEGICHGWALAASRYPEPQATVVTNKDGISVPFGASDVKALMSMHDAFNADAYYVRVGNRCRVAGKVPGEEQPEDGDVTAPSSFLANTPNCKDVNAGTFHIVISNMIGLHSMGFVADVDRFRDVWNQPITSYESELHEEVPLSSKEKRKGIHKKIRVTTKMFYGEELMFYDAEEEAAGARNFVSKEPVTGTPAQAFLFKNYEYILELNASGDIIGGEWISETRPDMLWGRAKESGFHNTPMPLAGLNQIYKPVSR